MEPVLRELDTDDTVLRDYMVPYRPLRHGLQFERFLAFWFDRDPDIRLLLSDRQVFSGDRTIGQVDFLLETEGQPVQLEVAVKFYLRRGDRTRLDRYVGTDMKDRLDLKLAHMLFHQRNIVVPGYSRSSTRSALSLRGRIFEPLLSDCGLSDRSAIQELRGVRTLPRSWWISLRNLRVARGTLHDLLHRYRWTVGDRNLWFSPVTAEEAEWHEWSDLESLTAADSLPGVTPATMVIGRDAGSGDAGETTRGFIVRE